MFYSKLKLPAFLLRFGCEMPARIQTILSLFIEAQSRPLLKKSGAMFITAVGETRFMGMEGKLEGVGGMICRIICRSMCGCCYSPYKWVLAQPYPPMKQDIFEKYVVNDKVRASISEEIPFQEAPIRQAMTRVFQHHAGGRVVINMESSA